MSEEIWFESGTQRINLSDVTRLYPAVLIRAAGESATVSLEWAELKADVIETIAYVLVFDVDPIGEVPLNRIEIRYETKDNLIEAMGQVASLLGR